MDSRNRLARGWHLQPKWIGRGRAAYDEQCSTTQPHLPRRFLLGYRTNTRLYRPPLLAPKAHPSPTQAELPSAKINRTRRSWPQWQLPRHAAMQQDVPASGAIRSKIWEMQTSRTLCAAMVGARWTANHHRSQPKPPMRHKTRSTTNRILLAYAARSDHVAVPTAHGRPAAGGSASSRALIRTFGFDEKHSPTSRRLHAFIAS